MRGIHRVLRDNYRSSVNLAFIASYRHIDVYVNILWLTVSLDRLSSTKCQILLMVMQLP